ncbi:MULTISPECIES: hypothetical protein [Clostridium]|nr:MULTISPECIES: hypothetical protein [Clostridium]
MIVIQTNLLEVTQMHKELLKLNSKDAFELYTIFSTQMAEYLIIDNDMIYVDDEIFIINYSTCFFIFLNYLLEQEYGD